MSSGGRGASQLKTCIMHHADDLRQHVKLPSLMQPKSVKNVMHVASTFTDTCVGGADSAGTGAQKLKSDIKALEARETHLRADLQEADLLRDGDSAKVKGLQVRERHTLPTGPSLITSACFYPCC